MYSESEIDGAVDAGVLTRESASAFRQWVAAQRDVPAADEEHFRLISGFNDIFVAIAAIIALVAAGSIGGGLAVAVVAWGLAEFFTLKRRMAFPSIVLLVAFVLGLFTGLMQLVSPHLSNATDTLGGTGITTLVLLVVAGAAALHWWRFKVPIAIAAITAALAAAVLLWVAYFTGAKPFSGDSEAFLLLLFVAGLAIFALAMRWDISDRERQTRRSDVAFWLHLLAAPLIVHPLFAALGAMSGELDVGGTVVILALYALMGLVALAVDRRAILVSALAYVLAALAALFRALGGIENDVAFTALIIGGLLLLLSAFWGPLRTFVVGRLPTGWQERLPVTHLHGTGARVE